MGTSGRRKRIGRLELACTAAALLMAGGSMVGAWTFNVLFVLLLLVMLYAVLRDVRALHELKARDRANAFSRDLAADRSSSISTPRTAHARGMDRASG